MHKKSNENQFHENNSQRLRCPNCGEPVKDGEKYCGNCGTILMKECYKCGKYIYIDKQYCPSCGTDNSEQAIKSYKEKEESNKKLEKAKNKKILIAIAIAILAIIALTFFVKYSNKCKELADQKVFITQFLYETERDYAGSLKQGYKGKYHSGYLAIKKNDNQTVSYFIFLDDKIVIANENYNDLLASYCQDIINHRRIFDEKIQELFVYINSGYFELGYFSRYNAKELANMKDYVASSYAIYTEPYKKRFLKASYITDSNIELLSTGEID